MTKNAPKRMAFEYVLYLSEMFYNHIIDNQLCRVNHFLFLMGILLNVFHFLGIFYS